MTALLGVVDGGEEMMLESTSSLLTEDCTATVGARDDHTIASIELESGSEGRDDDDNGQVLDAIAATQFNVERRSSYCSLTQFDDDNAQLFTNCNNTERSKEISATAPLTTAIESESVDVARFFLILLVVIGHLIEPYYKVGNQFASTIMHLIYSFHVPAFVFLSGYTSGLHCADNNESNNTSMKKRWHRQRRSMTRLLLPYLIMQPLFCIWYTSLYYKGGDVGAGSHENHGADQQSNGENQTQIMEFTPNWTLYNQHPWTMSHPFAHLWYLVSLLTMRIWAPYGLELRFTVPIHMLLGCCVGYSTNYNRFLSLHRTVVLMPYFLSGVLTRGRWNCFIPHAKSVPLKIAVGCITGTLIVAAIFATQMGVPVEVWFQSDPYAKNNKEYAGGLIQLGCYAVSSLAMSTFFLLIPSSSDWGVVQRAHIENADENDTTISDNGTAHSGRTHCYCAIRPQRSGQAKEHKQKTIHARIYLRLAKWGQRSLYAYVLHMAGLIMLEQAGYYDNLWSLGNEKNNPTYWSESIQEVAGTMALASVLTIGLVLRPLFPTFLRFILEPDMECAFHQEDT